MKQHITPEQLNDLSDSGKAKLREWWKPNEGDWFTNVPLKVNGKPRKNPKLSEELSFSDSDYGWNDPKTNSQFWIAYPLLSIGQMIEFLEGNRLQIHELYTGENSHSWYVDADRGLKTHFNEDELCDALWEAVKSILEK